ncbi:glycosyltransferase family 2 protein [Raoultella terrigena]|uniref:glycosyltransferase family 2 protein n=1 Tax=Raoultella terrigena TaxID=577 RepID=UPI0021CB303B|nr:glycosyltransferase family 2 protein [Raoultella terrigena]
MMMKKIDVLLATYNGEKFIEEQISSVLSNFDKLNGFDCRILVSDDKSTDNTIAVINALRERDNRIVFLDGNKKGGVRLNFYYLIERSEADYIFFCDQDDLWLPCKISTFLERFRTEEASFDGPVLVHSDLCVADKDLSPVHVSMFDYQKINKSPNFSRLVVSNSVTGCVMACNKQLLEGIKTSKITDSIMHDWYIGLFASAFGRVSFIDKAYILYRQHGGNQVGAKSFSIKDIFNVRGINDKIYEAKISVMKTKSQAEVFLEDFQHQLDDEKREFLENYISSFKRGRFLKRAHLYISQGVRKEGLLRNIVFFFVYVFNI